MPADTVLSVPVAGADPWLALRLWAGFGARGLVVLFDAEAVGGKERAGEDVFGGRRESDVRHAGASPTSGNGEEERGLVGDEGLLEFRREHEVAVALADGGESGEDVTADAEVGCTHVGGLFGPGEREGDTAEVSSGHGMEYRPVADYVAWRNRK
jgi:hypothetical protein